VIPAAAAAEGRAAGLIADCAAVVFDCDGVLADTEPLAVATWAAVLSPFGYTPGPADIRAALGRSFPDTRDIYAARVRGLPTARELRPRFDSAFLGLLERDPRAFDDGIELARELAAQAVPLAVASSSPRVRLDAILLGIDVIDLFGVSVAGDEVANGKPAPDPYLRAAAGLQVDPRDCVAIEDSTAGIASAVAAGMRTVGVYRGAAVDLGAAHVVVSSLRSLARAPNG
jgi:HAD superfamily hydrolase (TIGR01509 family)